MTAVYREQIQSKNPALKSFGFKSSTIKKNKFDDRYVVEKVMTFVDIKRT